MDGIYFDASRKTPFTIYTSMGDILESGYLKLDSIKRDGSDVTYSVTLYGGLGSFLYAMSYDEDGNKRTLADINYLGTDDPDNELNFYINKEEVKAYFKWVGVETGDRYEVTSFAPAYEGIPEGDFSADKVVANPTTIGLDNRVDGYSTDNTNGYALFSLAQKHDEWAMKDLRSYLQRPVFSLRAFFKALRNPDNCGGYNVDVSQLLSEDTFGKPYNNLYMTLPTLTSLAAAREKAGNLEVSFASDPSSD